jgi:hypothetical protein
MTYLPENIFKNILSYCGYEEVERRQRQLKNINDNHISYSISGSKKEELTYQNYIDYELVYSFRDTKAEQVRNTIILNGYIFPNIFDRYGRWRNPIARLISISKCLNLKKKDCLIAKIKFAKNCNILDCDCCNGVRKAKENKQIVLCELLKKPITWRSGGFCYTGLCEEIKQRC